jgi:hypothetical protein
VPDEAAFCPTCGAATPTRIAEDIPDEFEQQLTAALADRYRIDRELGRGGMAIVYLAHDIRHERDVALKVLRPELAASLGGDRFVREIKIAAKLNHPNILALFDSGDADGFLFYVMPFVEGESLRDKLRREKQLPIDEALQITKEVAEGLDYAHELGVIHRDIKPENILMSRGHALIADFGIARAVSSAGGAALTSTGTSVGTPLYMSPEQAAGDPSVDHRADIYSLGCVLYELLAGEPPFTGPNVQAIMAKHAIEPRPSVRTIRDTVPEAVDAAIMRAMAKAMVDRYPTGGEFVRAQSEEGARSATLGAAVRVVGRGTVERMQPLQSLGGRVLRTVATRMGSLLEYLPTRTILLLLVLAILLGTVGQSAFVDAYRYWVAGEEGRSNPLYNLREGWRLFRAGRPRIMADGTRLLIKHLYVDRRVETYGPNGWARYAFPGIPILALEMRDTSWVYVSRGGDEQVLVYMLEGDSALLTDTLPFKPTAAFSTGDMAVLGSDEGTVYRLVGDEWLLEQTGLDHEVNQFWTEGDVLIAISQRGMAAHDGVAWHEVDLTQGDDVSWYSLVGHGCPDGTSLVWGSFVPDPTMSGSEERVLAGRFATGDWREVDLGLPEDFDVNGVMGSDTVSCDLYGWGWDGLFQFKDGNAEVIEAFGERSVVGVGELEGEPHVLLSNGQLWALGPLGWGVITEAPGSRLLDVTVGTLKWEFPHNIASISETTLFSVFFRETEFQDQFTRISAHDSTLWLLTDGGHVLSVMCEEREDNIYPQCSGTWMPPPDVRKILDIEALVGHSLLAVGEEGLMAVWDGRHWESWLVPSEIQQQTFSRILRASSDEWVLLGDTVVLRADRDGNLLADTLLPAQLSVTVGTDSWRTRALPIGELCIVAACHLLSDGRLVIGTRQVHQLDEGGILEIRWPPYSFGSGSWPQVDLPREMDVYSITDDGSRLWVVGDGYSVVGIPIAELPSPGESSDGDSLPFPNEARN